MKKRFFKLLVTSILFLGSGIAACTGTAPGSRGGGTVRPIPERPDPQDPTDPDPTDPEDPVDPAKTYLDVTFDYNDGTGRKDVVKVEKNTPATRPATDPTRAGYSFVGWCTDAEGTSLWDFSKSIKSKRTLYAGWRLVHTVTFDTGSERNTVSVIHGEVVKKPTAPTKAGYAFTGWATDVSKGYYYDFTQKVTSDFTLTATWGPEGSSVINGYIFEAEFCPDLPTTQGATYSGGAAGVGLIHNDGNDDGFAEASNGYYVQFLYCRNCKLTFEITSDRDVTDAKIYMRLSGEYHAPGFSICGNENDPRCVKTASVTDNLGMDKGALYTIKLNGTPITNYGNSGDGFITFYVETPLANNKFSDYVLCLNASLHQGVNTIEMITDNVVYMYGTAEATAPMVDCLKIFTTAKLSFSNADETQTDGR